MNFLLRSSVIYYYKLIRFSGVCFVAIFADDLLCIICASISSTNRRYQLNIVSHLTVYKIKIILSLSFTLSRSIFLSFKGDESLNKVIAPDIN